MCDRRMLLHDGEISYIGDSEEAATPATSG